MRDKEKRVYIEWEDTIGDSGWFNKAGAERWRVGAVGLIRDVGWLVEETKTHIVLASRISRGDDYKDRFYGGLSRIFKPSIIKMKRLRTSDENKKEKTKKN